MRRLSLVAIGVCGLASGCWDFRPPDNSGSLGGQVLLSGPVRGASVVVDQLNVHTGSVYQHVGEAMTDDRGRFMIPETREANGLFQIVSRGGSFDDLATGATIELDDTDELTSLVWFEILDQRDDALVSPVGHLVAARAWSRLETFGDMRAAVDDAMHHLNSHFGNADWSWLKPANLGQHQTSPTEPVRAALIQAALSYLVKDIAVKAGASPQQLNVYTLLQRWTADLVRMNDGDTAVWDGNDGNDRALGSGLQLGACEPIDPGCQVPPTACNTGQCRVACDLYVNTPRAMLAGAMTKIIRDTGNGGVNQTGLRIEDTLAVARAVSDNGDPDLFGGGCVENLDRTPPEIRWDETVSPSAEAVVRGVISLKAIGIDDVDLRPRTEIVGYPDGDGDPSNNVAIASIDTALAVVSDGGLTVTARAVDLAGNSSTVERRVIVDNTPPQLELSPSGFFVDGPTWWTSSAGPTLTGTYIDDHPATVQAMIGATQVMGTLSGGSWSVALPAGTIDLAGGNVTIRVTDRAGNHAELTQQLRRDVSPPELSFQSSTVNNEAPEAPTFTSGALNQGLNHIPVHVHGGPTVALDAAGPCPSITKYSYLLGEFRAAYGYEVDTQGNERRNPLRYQLMTADDGVGIASGTTQYRVGRRVGTSTTWILDWTGTGAGTPVSPGTTLFGVGIFSNLVAGLDTTEGIYDVEFRATDRLARTTTAARCFDLRLKAPPLEFLSSGAPITPHTYQLDALSLSPGAPFDLVAARLLNDNASGASLIDQPFFNGTASTVYLTVTVTKPTQVNATQSYVIDYARRFSDPTVSLNCYPMGGNPADCVGPPPRYDSGLVSSTSVAATFRVRVFELNASEIPSTEIPCIGSCDPVTTTAFRFAIPPRASSPIGTSARKYIAMTMIGPVASLRPNGGASPVPPTVMPPFVDATIGAGMPRITGLVSPFVTLCTRVSFIGPFGQQKPYCTERSEVIPYRALASVRLSSLDLTRSDYETAPTEAMPPAPPGPTAVFKARSDFDRTLTEGTLPTP